jgi:hypothetical protein
MLGIPFAYLQAGFLFINHAYFNNLKRLIRD